jgi:hypothetical protein
METRHHTSLGPVSQRGSDVRTKYFHAADVIEGIGYRVGAYSSATVLTAYMVVNAYHIEAKGKEYWLIGRPFTFALLERNKRRDLEHKAYFIALLGCLSLDGPPRYIILASSGENAVWCANPGDYGLRELTNEEVLATPRSIRKQARADRRKSGHTGLYCPDVSRLPLLAKAAIGLLGVTSVGLHEEASQIGPPQPRSWAIQAAKMLRMLQSIDTVHLDIGRLRSDWPRGKMEVKLTRWSGGDQIDAMCLPLSYEADGEMVKFSRARGYPITSPTAPFGASNMWWVLGDLWLHNLARDPELQKKLTAARIIVLTLLGTPWNQIIIPRGFCAKDKLEPYFRELDIPELSTAPREILKFSAEARELWPTLRTGLVCPDESKADEISRIAEELANDKPMTVHGALNPVKLCCGNILKTCLNEGRIELAQFGWRVGLISEP